MELLTALVIAIIATIAWRFRLGESRSVIELVDRIAPRAPIIAFAITVACGIVIARVYGMPLPRTQDELSYVLGGETFASGRLANPQHPLWRSFETFHVLVHPTYASKYPPSQSMVLAFGQLLFGRQIVGAWLSCGAAAAAIAWMMRAIGSAREALLAGVVASIMIGTSYWVNSYWGGAVAAGAAALVVGGTHRWLEHGRARDATALAIGVALLALSRPFEGALLTLAFGALLAWKIWKTRPAIARTLVLPAAIVLGLTGAFLLRYDAAVTGHPFLLPYMLYERDYGPMPVFVWGTPRSEPAVPAQVFADLVAYNRARHEWVTDPATAPMAVVGRLIVYMKMFLAAPLVPLVFAALLDRARRREILFTTGALVFCIAGMLCAEFTFPHYAAPVMCLCVLLVVRAVSALAARGRAGAYVAAGVIALYAWRAAGDGREMANKYAHEWHHARHRMERHLAASGRHVILVKYAAPHDFLEEWVSNHADIDASPVVWARSLDEETDARVLDYYGDRKAWTLTVSANRNSLVEIGERR
jgi:hypothetical protein